jgi:hypothetical protein
MLGYASSRLLISRAELNPMRHPVRSDSSAEQARITPESLALIQGVYYSATGIWPLLHMRSFEAITGPKADRWLVRTVGALVGVIGGALLSSARSGRTSPEIRGLAVGSAAALAAVDVIYVARRRIPPVYLLDAAAECGLVAGWAWAEHARRRERPVDG